MRASTEVVEDTFGDIAGESRSRETRMQELRESYLSYRDALRDSLLSNAGYAAEILESPDAGRSPLRTALRTIALDLQRETVTPAPQNREEKLEDLRR